ncbi:MAG TPA: hypothetical protein H9866_01525 [Candidatus Tidjanibacter gallistercoris]|nr:hypothetical protein [Candidatus Tidjanibacter gallistercoris]
MELFQDKLDKKDCTLDMGRGCEFCGGGDDDVSAGVCGGCFKLHVTDWLKDYPDTLPGDIYEVRFKNTRRGYYQNVNGLALKEGDIVAVEAAPGHDIGIVSLSGDMVARQMRRVGFNPQNGEFRKIYRKAKPYDIEKWQEAIALEHSTMIRARQIAAEMNLNMKIGDVEYQGDKIKAIFYYIADERVDFRELIKVFAEVFHIRVEMKQIGARQEAGRIGGIGSCGRELCCASWISSFMSVTTNAARMQDISLNPQKLAGQCSKLKCCLIYEYDDYMDARREFPKVSEPLHVLEGDYYFVKNDILARTMSFSSAPGSMAGLVSLPVERVREIMKLNAKGMKPERLEAEGSSVRTENDPGFVNVIGEDSITRFDNARKKKKSRGGRGREEQQGGEGQRRKPEAPRAAKNGAEPSQERAPQQRTAEGTNVEGTSRGGNNRRRDGNGNGGRRPGTDGGRDNRRGDRPAAARPQSEQQGKSAGGGERPAAGDRSRQRPERSQGQQPEQQNKPAGNGERPAGGSRSQTPRQVQERKQQGQQAASRKEGPRGGNGRQGGSNGQGRSQRPVPGGGEVPAPKKE